MILPHSVLVSLEIRIEGLEPDGFGRTNVTATFAGCALRPMRVDGDVERVGFEALWPAILSGVLGQISDGLAAYE